MTENHKIQLHLGCGKRYIPGFIHVDLSDYPHIDYKHNIKDLSIKTTLRTTGVSPWVKASQPKAGKRVLI